MAKRTKSVELDFMKADAPRSVLSNMFAASVAEVGQARPVAIDALADNPFQPRLVMDETGLAELAQVIKAQGFQGVLVARPHPEQEDVYQLTAGHRRREASRRAGLTMLPVVVHDLSNEEMAAIAITENIQREDLTALEEGKIFQLMTDEMGYTHEQIAHDIGKNRGYVENRLRVARAPQDVQDLVRAKPDSLRAVSTLIKVKDPARRAEAVALLQSGHLTTDDLLGFLDTPAKTTTKPSTQPRTTSSEPHSQTRVGHSKLMTIQRTLDAYTVTLDNRNAISEQERQTLATIAQSVVSLCHDYDVPFD